MSIEPQTTAKVRIHTSKGIIDIELWAKETPITSKLFLNSILNEEFNGLEFNKIIPNFLIQINSNDFGETFIDEFNSRLKFNRRGLLGSVNLNKKNSNVNRFFITLNETSELNNKNTMFGKVTNDGIFTVLKISEGEIDGERPVYPVKITKSEVLIPYFDDLVKIDKKVDKVVKPKKKKQKIKLNIDNEDDIDLDIKMKSLHETKKDKKEERKDSKEAIQVEKVEEKVKEKAKEKVEDKVEEKEEKLEEVETQKTETKEETAYESKASKPEDYDENFDNLDSDTEFDLFSHELKF